MYGEPVGTRYLTGGTTLVPQGFQARLLSVSFLTAGTTFIKFLSGGSNGTAWVTESGYPPTPQGKTVPYGAQGHLFGDGIYYYPDGNTTSATISFKKETSNQ